MASLNRVILVGNLTKDPEVRSTPDGTSVANLRIAVNRPWTNKQGERDTDFFTIVVWRKLAELCGQYLSKGSPVAVEGRLQSRNWETGEGQKRSITEVVADNIQFLTRGSGSTEQHSNADADTSSGVEQQEQQTSSLEPVGAGGDDFEDLPDDDVPF